MSPLLCFRGFLLWRVGVMISTPLSLLRPKEVWVDNGVQLFHLEISRKKQEPFVLNATTAPFCLTLSPKISFCSQIQHKCMFPMKSPLGFSYRHGPLAGLESSWWWRAHCPQGSWAWEISSFAHMKLESTYLSVLLLCPSHDALEHLWASVTLSPRDTPPIFEGGHHSYFLRFTSSMWARGRLWQTGKTVHGGL